MHRDTLILCGLPEFVFSNEGRWHRFIEHGGWDQETGWSVAMLSPSQAAKLADLIRNQYDNVAYRELLLILDTKVRVHGPGGDSRSAANKVQQHESRSSRRGIRGNLEGRVGVSDEWH